MGEAAVDADLVSALPDADPTRFDETALVDLVGNDVATLRGLYDLYLASCARCASEVEAALQAGDLDAAFAGAHRLKSSSHHVGAIRLSRVAASIEAMARERPPGALDSLRPLMERCRIETDAAQRWIRAQRSRLTE